MMSLSQMRQFLMDLGCWVVNPTSSMLYVLDGISSEYYLVFDLSLDDDRPETHGSVDIYVAKVGESPHDIEQRIRIATDRRQFGIARLIDALGLKNKHPNIRQAIRKLMLDDE